MHRILVKNYAMGNAHSRILVAHHAYTPFMVLFSKPIWDTYSPEEQEILVDCAIVGRDVQRAASRALSQESLARIEAAGVAVNDISEENMAEIRDAVQGVYARHADKIGSDVVDQMQAALAQLRD